MNDLFCELYHFLVVLPCHYPVLGGFEWHCQAYVLSIAINKSQQHQEKQSRKGWESNPGHGCWKWSRYATSGPCIPLLFGSFIWYFTDVFWGGGKNVSFLAIWGRLTIICHRQAERWSKLIRSGWPLPNKFESDWSKKIDWHTRETARSLEIKKGARK